MGRRAINPRPVMPLVRQVLDRKEALGLSSREVGSRAGVVGQTLSHWNVGRCAPSLFEFECVVTALGGTLRVDFPNG